MRASAEVARFCHVGLRPTGDTTMTGMLRGIALCMVSCLLAAAQPFRAAEQRVIVMRDAPLCMNYGDIVVFSLSGQPRPSCVKLFRDMPAIQFGSADHDIVEVAPREAPNDRGYTLQSAIQKTPQ